MWKTAAKADGATATAIAMLKTATQRGKTGRGWSSRRIASARVAICAMIMPTGTVNVIQARSFSSWVTCGSRSGRNAATSQNRSASAISVAPLTAALR